MYLTLLRTKEGIRSECPLLDGYHLGVTRLEVGNEVSAGLVDILLSRIFVMAKENVPFYKDFCVIVSKGVISSSYLPKY